MLYILHKLTVFFFCEGAITLSSAHFGPGSGPILMDDVACTGTESWLTSCLHTSEHNCNHSQDVSVHCGCTNGDIHLLGGSGPHEGRVQICINHVWGTICDDSWSSNDASVVCTQLGYSRSGKLYSRGKGLLYL